MAAFDMIAYSRLWRDRLGRFSSVTSEGRAELAEQIQAISRATMERLIYQKPETVNATGRRLWKRTRNLIDHEKAEVRGGDVVLTNNVVYAHRRHEAGKPEGFPIDPARVAHWREVSQPQFRQAQWEISAQKLRQLLTRK